MVGKFHGKFIEDTQLIDDNLTEKFFQELFVVIVVEHSSEDLGHGYTTAKQVN